MKLRFVILPLGLLLPAALLIGCPSSPLSSEPLTCTEAQPLSAAPIVGSSLGAKQLALTFDDGPGSRTAELSTYLKGKGIRAAFFINGNSMPVGAAGTALLAQLVNDGHVVANHTQTHEDLTSLPQTPGGNAQMIKELADTDTIIAPFVPNNRFLFRAPYGAWNANTYNVLSASAMNKYVGHIEWDYGGERTATTAADWACWQVSPKLSSKDCGDLYIKEIEDSVDKRGIVLFHDADYGDNANGAVGNTIDMVKYIVPLLEAKGYTWKRVDEVPAIANLLPPLPQDAGADAAKDASADASSDATTDSGVMKDAGVADTGASNPNPNPNPTPTTPPANPSTPSNPCPDASTTTASRKAHAH